MILLAILKVPRGMQNCDKNYKKGEKKIMVARTAVQLKFDMWMLI